MRKVTTEPGVGMVAQKLTIPSGNTSVVGRVDGAEEIENDVTVTPADPETRNAPDWWAVAGVVCLVVCVVTLCAVVVAARVVAGA